MRRKTLPQAIQLTASKPDVYDWSACRQERMLRYARRARSR